MAPPKHILQTGFKDGERLFWSSQDMLFSDHKGSPIAIKAGFLSDGLSIPMVFQNVFSKSPHYIYAGILHDYGYRLDFPHPMSRKEVDKLFLHYMKLYGVGWFTRHMIYRAVRVGGWMSYGKRNAEYWKKSLTIT